MEPDERAGAEPMETAGTPSSRALLIVGAAALAVAAVVTAAVVVWWKRGGARRAVTNLAEQSAVALADALVDEILPAA